MNPSSPFWYPFRSQEVADICAHLTCDESNMLKKMSRIHGGMGGVTIGIFSHALIFSGVFFFPSVSVWWICLGVPALILPVTWLLTIPLRKKQKSLLASTSYARTRGLTTESLRMYALKRA